MHEAYARQEVLAQLAQAFEEQGIVRLEQFLTDKDYLAFARQLWDAKGKIKQVPDQYAFTTLSSKLASFLFTHAEFRAFLERVLGKKSIRAFSVRKFGWKNYTLIHDEHTSKEQIRFFFCVAGEWDAHWGGTLTYLTGDGEGTSLFFPVTGNCLCIIRETQDMHSFIKYINHHAGKEQFIVVEGIVR